LDASYFDVSPTMTHAGHGGAAEELLNNVHPYYSLSMILMEGSEWIKGIANVEQG
jgi:hypothetical protein